jgi:hypothetical protein
MVGAPSDNKDWHEREPGGALEGYEDGDCALGPFGRVPGELFQVTARR